MKGLTGRKKELQLLNSLQEADKSEFLAVYGRRRVGKTFLIRTAFNGQFTFQLTGLANATTKQQLANFHTALVRHHVTAERIDPAAKWFDAFQQLITFLETQTNRKKIVFFDELPWLDTQQSGFISALEHFWNSWASNRTDIILIGCGSAASWMINKLINNRGGLHNRVTRRIKLEPFTLTETEVYFAGKSAVFDRYQLIQLYMVLGGIPYYLELVDVGMSAAQNIDKLCFDADGLLRTEFTNLYTSLFKKAQNHMAAIEALAKKAKGLSREELVAAAKLPNGGGTSLLLSELEECGFIRKYISFGKKEKNSLYQLIDFYSLFYQTFIKNSGTLDKNTWLNGLDSPQYRAWSGYAFEMVCLHHLNEIKQALGISGVQTTTSAWLSNASSSKAQIDLVIDRRDHVITICEMKFSINPFAIDKKYAAELRNKIGVFKEQTATKKAVYLALITTYGLVKNEYSTSLVQNSLTMDVLFND